MRVRIGFGLGTASAEVADPARLRAVATTLEQSGFDSLWLSERATGPVPDPLVALAMAAAWTDRLKLGTSVLVVPGRNPALLAKELATVDRLSGGRLLPAVGLGIADGDEQQAFGVERRERASRFDEVLPLLRRFWSGEPVTWAGDHHRYDHLRILPTPVQTPLEVWLGGRSPAELRRVGRLGDGWLPSFCTPEEAAAGRALVDEAASAAGRSIDRGHFGALVVVADGRVPDRLAALVEARSPGTPVERVVARDATALRELLQAFVEVGFTKFVVVPAGPSGSEPAGIEALAAAVLDLQR